MFSGNTLYDVGGQGTVDMIFDWDDSNLAHIAEHDVTAEEAEQAIKNDPFDLEAQEDEIDGFRYRQLGETDLGRILVVISTARGVKNRVITAWNAPISYKHFYLRERAKQLWKAP